MERSQTDTDGSSNRGGDLGPHFTDWREQLRDRVREIRARKLAGKRVEENGEPTPEPDLAEQAAAARAEKLRAAREAIDAASTPVDMEPELIADSARIEQRLEELNEEADEVAEEAAVPEDEWVGTTGVEFDVEANGSDAAATSSDDAAEDALEVEASGDDLEWDGDEVELSAGPAIAALEDSAAAIRLGSGDRSARRSDVADVIDSLLGGPAAADEDPDAQGPDHLDIDVLPDGSEEPNAAERALEATDEDEVIDFEAAQQSWDEEEDASGEDEEAEIEAGAAADEHLLDEASEHIAAAEEDPDPFANAPAWARASFAPRQERAAGSSIEKDADRIPPELEDVEIPAWALPRQAAARNGSEPAADLFATEEDPGLAAVVEPTAAATEQVDAASTEAVGTAEQDESEAEQLPADAQNSEDVELLEPEEEDREKPGLFAEDAPSAPSSVRPSETELELESHEIEETLEKTSATAADLEAEFSDDPAIEVEADFEIDAVDTAEAEEEMEREPDSAIAAAIDAAIQRPSPVERKEDPKGDVFLVGEFRTRGRVVKPALEDTTTKRPESGDAASVGPPKAASVKPAAQERSKERSKPEVEPVAARAGLFDEEADAPEAADPADEIEWDLDSSDDPAILDARIGDADPSAPVTDRVFSAVADAMVLLTIAMLLAIAGSRAAGAPIVPFVQAAPLPFFLAVMLFGFAYAVFFNGTCGQTLGKMAMRVRVIGGDSFRVGYPRAAQRALYYLVATLPAGLGLLPALRDPEHRALHDRLSNTRVVKA